MNISSEDYKYIKNEVTDKQWYKTHTAVCNCNYFSDFVSTFDVVNNIGNYDDKWLAEYIDKTQNVIKYYIIKRYYDLYEDKNSIILVAVAFFGVGVCEALALRGITILFIIFFILSLKNMHDRNVDAHSERDDDEIIIINCKNLLKQLLEEEQKRKNHEKIC